MAKVFPDGWCEHSKLSPFDKLGHYAPRAPTGRYELLGNSLYTDGDVLIDSVLRFKGRAAPCGGSSLGQTAWAHWTVWHRPFNLGHGFVAADTNALP